MFGSNDQTVVKMAPKHLKLEQLSDSRPCVYFDPELGELSNYWVVPESGSCAGRDVPGRFRWSHSIRRFLRGKKNKGRLGKRLAPVPSRSQEYAGGGHRWDLVVRVGGKNVKFARMLSEWLDVDGEKIEQEDMEEYESNMFLN